MTTTASPQQLFAKLAIYFVVLTAAATALATFSPSALQWLPIAGNDAIEIAEIEETPAPGDAGSILAEPVDTTITAEQAGRIILFLAISLLLTTLLMVPVAWTYIASRYEAGFRKSFPRVLVALPVCATTIVLLIQDSLALAFGLAALVAAVRFRVSLQDPIDGIYIFAAICVGLAIGIGYAGIATVMVLFFCSLNALLWSLDFGRNTLDDARASKEREKLARTKVV